MNLEDEIARADEPGYVRELDALARVDQLTRDLAESRKATESVQAALFEAEARHKARADQMGADYLEACARHGRTMQALARANAQQVQLVRALRTLADAVRNYGMYPNKPGTAEAVSKARREALEVLALVEVPFSG